MENNDPLHFFKSLAYYNSVEFIRDRFYEITSQYDIISIDTSTDTVVYNTVFHDENGTPHECDITLTFEKFLTDKLLNEISNYKYAINEIILDIVKSGNSPKEFIILQHSTLLKLKTKILSLYPEKIILAKSAALLSSFLTDEYTEYFDIKEKHTRDKSYPLLPVSEDFSPYSFKWDAINSENTIPAVELLYQLLTEKPALIESSKEDFIAAFTQRKVVEGIRWKIIPKNKQFSKSSLFYFIYSLIDEGFIEDVPSQQLNKMIEYTFKDNEGNKLKNIGQSKYSVSKNPTQKERIDIIVRSIII